MYLGQVTRLGLEKVEHLAVGLEPVRVSEREDSRREREREREITRNILLGGQLEALDDALLCLLLLGLAALVVGGQLGQPSLLALRSDVVRGA
jgi:hypothetical protein